MPKTANEATAVNCAHPLCATAARRFGLDLCSTHARRHDRYVRKGHRSCKLGLHDRQFFDLAALLQTFRQTPQRPDIIRMLRAPLNSPAQAQVVTTDLLSLAVMALLRQQRRKRMPRWMHLGPRFDVLQIVVSIDRFPQMPVGDLVIAL